MEAFIQANPVQETDSVEEQEEEPSESPPKESGRQKDDDEPGFCFDDETHEQMWQNWGDEISYLANQMADCLNPIIVDGCDPKIFSWAMCIIASRFGMQHVSRNYRSLQKILTQPVDEAIAYQTCRFLEKEVWRVGVRLAKNQSK